MPCAEGDECACTYDACSNLISRAGQALVYDAENRLIRVRNAANSANILRVIYDGDGQRILTVDSTGTKVTLDKLYEKNLTTGDETLFVYAGSRLIATKKNGTISTIHPDHLGGIALTMQGGTVVSDLAFYPFGEQRSSSTGTPTSDRRFNGESLISSVGLYQMGARWYDPAIGRWVQPDSIVPNPGDPQNLNRYAYVGNNPLRFTDPSGHCPLCIVALGAVVVGGMVYGYLSNPTVANAPDIGDATIVADEWAGVKGGIANAPVIGTADSVVAGATGYDPLTGDDLSGVERVAVVALAAAPGGGKSVLHAGFEGVQHAKLSITKVAGAVINGKDGKVIATGTVDISKTLERIKNNVAHRHPNDGTIYKNLPNKKTGQRLLPIENDPDYYREYVVDTPGVPGGSAGPQRLMIGKSGEVYYTPDHYETAIQVGDGAP